MMTAMEAPILAEQLTIVPANEASWRTATPTEIAHSFLAAGVSNTG